MTKTPAKQIANIGDLTTDPKNARAHNPRNIGQVRDSLQRYGAARSIVIDEAGQIIAGHGVVEAAALAGIERVQVVDGDGETIIAVRRSGLTKKQKQELGVADNRGAELATWDADMLKELAGEIDLAQFWKPDELAELLGTAGNDADDPGADIDRAAELQAKYKTAVGQMWAVGNHRLLCADCLDIANIQRVLSGEVPDMIFADPPYGINIVTANVSVGGGVAYDIPFGGKKRLGSANAAKPFGSKAMRGSVGAAHVVGVGKYAPVIGDETTDTAVKSSALLLDMFPAAVHVWWGGNYYADKLPASACWLVWNKETTGNFADCELAWTNQDKAARLLTHKWNGMLRESERGRRWHPTQKPSALAAWAYNELGHDSDIILDPFCGCGPTLVAGQQNNRKVRAIELSAEYLAVELERLSLMGLSPVLSTL